jgi:hypothetical protein
VAWLHALAACAGMTLTTFSVDDDSVDAGIMASGKYGHLRAPNLHFQLKCTETDTGRGAALTYRIKRKNYDDLRSTDLHVPRLLVVLSVPRDPLAWSTQTPDRMALHHCAYWKSLHGARPLVSNKQDRVAVTLPRDHVFDVAGVQDLVERLGKGQPL